MLCPACQAENADGADHCFTCGQPLGALRVLKQGSLVAGRYEIVAPLGQGGMGMVYRAHDRLLDEVVAIKVLRSEVARDADIARRFQSEIKLARRVSHRNVCRIHEYGEDQGQRYISMEFIEGVDLRQVIRQGRGLTADQAFEAALQVCEGLAAIHEVGVIHRDLKTPNIMRDRRGVLKLMDFGIAKESGVEGTATATGLIIGTPEYMSPEQARGGKIDFRSDIYALGVVVFEIFTGRVPFRADTPLGTILMHLQEPPPLDGGDAAGIPDPVKDVLRRALAKGPSERYGSVAEMADALRHARAAAAAGGGWAVPFASGAALPATAPVPAPTPVPHPTAVPHATAIPHPTATPHPTAVPHPTATAHATAAAPVHGAGRGAVWPYVLLGGALAVVGLLGLAVIGLLGQLGRATGPSPEAEPSPVSIVAEGPPVSTPAMTVPAPPATTPPEPPLATPPPTTPRDAGVRRGAAPAAARTGSPPSTVPLTAPPATAPERVEPLVPPAVQGLIADLQGASARGRWNAAEALGNLGAEARAAVPALVTSLEDRSEDVRWRSAEALGKIGAEARPAVAALVRALADRDGLVRTEAAKALGRLGASAKEAVPALADGLRSSDTYYRREAAKALAKIGPDANTIPALVGGLRDKDKFVRAECARALGRVGPEAKAAVPALTAAARDSEIIVSREAAAALELILGRN